MSVCREFGVEGIVRNAVLDALSWVLHILSTGMPVRLAGWGLQSSPLPHFPGL